MKEGLKRSILSILLEDYPLIPDTLNKMWDSLLVSTDIPVKTRTRVSVTDFQERTSVAHSENISGLLSADSLLSYYLGERCEVEATGFISYGWKRSVAGDILLFAYHGLSSLFYSFREKKSCLY